MRSPRLIVPGLWRAAAVQAIGSAALAPNWAAKNA
jgi:hypothetical protein